MHTRTRFWARATHRASFYFNHTPSCFGFLICCSSASPRPVKIHFRLGVTRFFHLLSRCIFYLVWVWLGFASTRCIFDLMWLGFASPSSFGFFIWHGPASPRSVGVAMLQPAPCRFGFLIWHGSASPRPVGVTMLHPAPSLGVFNFSFGVARFHPALSLRVFNSVLPGTSPYILMYMS